MRNNPAYNPAPTQACPAPPCAVAYSCTAVTSSSPSIAPTPPCEPLPAWGPQQLTAASDFLCQPDRLGSAPTFDLAVVGAGIAGAGIARDAAQRGLSVLVLEAADVAYGTSSRSTRLIHGGVRYLEQGEVGLVYEALRERSRLYAMAPHLVRRARFLFPAYRGDRLGPLRLRLGLTLYDALNLHRDEPHAYLGPEACHATEPLLAEIGLRGAVQYEDAITDDARLTLTVLQSARAFGARVSTYTPVTRIDGAPRGEPGVVLHTERGAVWARCAVAAVGPWTDGRLLGKPGAQTVTKSKGIHLVLRACDVPVRHPVVVQAPKQRRILFTIPWGSRTYVGTTDDPYEGDPGDSGVTEHDEVALLEVVSRLLPGASLRGDRVVSAWSGVRPLVREPGSTQTEELSRRHRVIEGAHGVLGLVGGKLTTYRAMAEEAVDAVVARLARDDVRPCATATTPLVAGEPLSLHDRTDPVLEDLHDRHGPQARSLAAAARGTQGQARLVDDLPYRWCEVDQAIAHEGCRHLDDILRRRLPLALTDPDLGGRVAREVAQRLVDAWGGAEADVREQLDRYDQRVERETRRRPTLG